MQEVRQGRRAAQNIQSNQDPDEDVLDASLGDMAVETNNLAATNEREQVRDDKRDASCKTAHFSQTKVWVHVCV